MEIEQIKVFREKLRQLERGIGNPFKSDEDARGLTMAQCDALLEIGKKPEVSLIELSSSLGLDASTLSRTINTLVLAGLVSRLSNSVDRRYLSISLTGQGRKVYEHIDAAFNRYFAGIFDLVPDPMQNFILESFTLFTNALMKYNVNNLRRRNEKEARP